MRVYERVALETSSQRYAWASHWVSNIGKHPTLLTSDNAFSMSYLLFNFKTLGNNLYNTLCQPFRNSRDREKAIILYFFIFQF